MNVVCLDTYKLQKDNTPFIRYKKNHSKEEAQKIAKELQKGYMQLLTEFKNN